VADTVNAKNDILLGSSGSVVVGLNSIPTAIGSQTYFDNTGLATTISTNSINDAVTKLMGTGTAGISLTSISSSLPSLSVSTGLDVSALSSINTNTSNTNTSAVATKTAVTTMAGGTTLAHIKLRSATSKTSYYYSNGSLATPSNYSYTTDYETYSYYAKGGFTGNGQGQADGTGFKQAGIVHEDEYVAPKWMVKSNPELFRNIEDARLRGSFANGGYSQPVQASVSTNNDQGKLSQYLFLMADEIKKLNSLMRRLSDGGEAMKVELVA
jgi:hypothetical protein